jgi:hypothetical protein
MMAIMASLNQKNNSLIYDTVRKKWVAATPEEMIRQWLIRQMVEKLGYPRILIAIEKELSQLPHLKLKPYKEIPKRRADIIVFSPGTLKPLLMIECKAVALTPKFAQQVIGYNTVVGASFLAMANDKHVLTGCFDTQAGMYQFKKGLPDFETLIAE